MHADKKNCLAEFIIVSSASCGSKAADTFNKTYGGSGEGGDGPTGTARAGGKIWATSSSASTLIQRVVLIETKHTDALLSTKERGESPV